MRVAQCRRHHSFLKMIVLGFEIEGTHFLNRSDTLFRRYDEFVLCGRRPVTRRGQVSSSVARKSEEFSPPVRGSDRLELEGGIPPSSLGRNIADDHRIGHLNS